MRAFAACALLLLLLAGCASTTQTGSTPTSGTGGPGGAATQTGGTGGSAQAPDTSEPFSADKSGDLRNEDASGSWDWEVGPGVKTFTVTFRIDGVTPEVPLYNSGGIEYRIKGDGPGHNHEAHSSSGGGVSVQNGSAPGCVVCLGDEDGFAGVWHFDFTLTRTTAHYSVHIETTY